MGTQPPADKPATKHEPLVSETLKEGAKRNLEQALRDTNTPQRKEQTGEEPQGDTGAGTSTR